MNIWRVLGLEPTRDIAAIRRAYAAAAKQYHPEEQPEEFQVVRKAYEQALAYARSAPETSVREGETPPEQRKRYANIENKSAPKKGVATGGTYLGPAGGGPRRTRPGPASGRSLSSIGLAGGAQEPDWLREETAEGQTRLFSRHPAMTAFRELWRQEKKRGDKSVWRDYFSSPDFLVVQREEGFAAALLEFLKSEAKSGQPVPQRFLRELAIVYGVRYSGRTPVYLSFAAFPGIDHIRSILLLGQPLDRLSHEEDKIWAACWRDYYELLFIAKSGGFFEEEKNPDLARRWKELFRRYRRERLTDRPEATRRREEEVEFRHPYGLRLLAALVRNHPLPAEALQYLYDDLRLETIATGGAKQDFKPLLDALLPVLPDQGREREEKEALARVKNAVEDFLRRYDRRRPFPHTDVLHSYDPAPGAEEREAARAVVEMPEFSRLLFTRRLEQSGVPDKIFGAPTVLATEFVAALGDRIKDRSDDPMARAMMSRCLESSNRWIHDLELFFDRPYSFPGASPEEISMDNREFWYYYLSTAFPAAVSTEREESLGSFISAACRPSLWWRRVFTGFHERAQRILRPKRRTFSLGGHQITIEFHFHYQVFFVDGEETSEQFPWAEFLALTGADPLLFWLLLPLAMGKEEERPAIRRELAARTRGWEVCAANNGKFVDCLVNHVVASRSGVSSKNYREDGRALYGHRVRDDLTLEVYRADGILRSREKLWTRPFSSPEIAEEAARQYIETLLTPPLLLLERRPVAGAALQQKAEALADCLGEKEYTWEDARRDKEQTPFLSADDFLGYGAEHHGSYTADFYRRYLHRPYRAGVRFGSQEGERFLLEFALEIWPLGADKIKQQQRVELLTQLGMLGEPAYFIGSLRLGMTRYLLLSNSLRELVFAVREGTNHYHSGHDLPSLLAAMLTPEEWAAVEFVERYENIR